MGPIVIGGTGGSGTRLVAQLVRAAGYDLGSLVNDQDDAIAFVGWLELWCPVVVATGEMTEIQKAKMKAGFQTCLKDHLISVQNKNAWGWKNPRSMLVLPFLFEQLPQMKFIHVVRDGRDMALSLNQQQANNYCELISSGTKYLPQDERAMVYWNVANSLTAEFGCLKMDPMTYCSVRYEDLCHNPELELEDLATFLGTGPIRGWEDIIKPSDGIGRYRARLAGDKLDILNQLGHNGLTRFGYIKGQSNE